MVSNQDKKQRALRQLLTDTTRNTSGEWQVFLESKATITEAPRTRGLSIQEQLQLTARLIRRLTHLLQMKKDLMGDNWAIWGKSLNCRQI